MLSTGAMVRLGKTFGNLMVDLRATNSKLRARTNRIVRQLTGLSAEEAAVLLQRCGGELKTALVAQLARLTPEEARARLQAVGGQVRQALGEPGASAPGGQPTPGVDTPGSPSVLYLGIDGGGSHTVALLADANGVTLGRGESGPCNLQAVGAERVLRALDDAVTSAFRAANLPRSAVTAACLGLAGSDRDDARRVLLDWAARVNLAARVELTSDVALLLAAGTPQGWGLAVVAGTGSIAYGRTSDNRVSRAGGWGHLLGDEGSGYALVLDALRAVARAADGRGPATRLSDSLLAALNLAQPQQMVSALHGGAWDRSALAALAPRVVEAADAGDEVASDILEQGAQDLALAAAAVACSLRLTGPVPLALAGGVLLSSASYRQRFLHALSSRGVQAASVTLVSQPAEGAVRLALAAPSSKS
jgi:N-acetylglucosamine kinase-like BadF-type ATPase